MHNRAKKEILKAYLAGIITKPEFEKYLTLDFPGLIMLDDGEMKPDDKEISDIADKIGFDIFRFDIYEIKPDDVERIKNNEGAVKEL